MICQITPENTKKARTTIAEKLLTALVLWADMSAHLTVCVTPRAVAQQRSKMIAYSLSWKESQREGLSLIVC